MLFEYFRPSSKPVFRKFIDGLPFAIDLNRSFVGARFDYADEKMIADHYVTDYQNNLRDQAAEWIAWMLEETQGEGCLTYLNGMSQQKSLGSCALDQNRFPKLIYEIYKNALWVPFSIRPGVALQSHWNLAGDQDVDAWSNCPKVELFLNGVSKGAVVPDAKLRCTWKAIPWEGGRMRVAIRAGFAPGAVQVEAEADGLGSALASFAVGPMEA